MSFQPGSAESGDFSDEGVSDKDYLKKKMKTLRNRQRRARRKQNKAKKKEEEGERCAMCHKNFCRG